MPKIKISVLCEVEYEPRPEHYPEGSTIEQMLAIDLKGVEDDVFLFLDTPNAKWTQKGEIIPD